METVLILLVILVFLLGPPIILGYLIRWILKKFGVARFSRLQIFIFSFGMCAAILMIVSGYMPELSPRLPEAPSPALPPSVSSPPPPKSPEAPPSVIPEFPWPPPGASASLVIPRDRVLGQLARRRRFQYFYYYDKDQLQALWKAGGPRLIHVDATLINALAEGGYYEASYYSVPDGFALVTRLEQIDPDGTPKPEPSRWEVEVRGLEKFALAEYLRALFLAKPGFYRIIVFVVTPHPFTQSPEIVTRDKATAWLRFGANALPMELALRPYSSAYTCTALIYEFEKIDVQAKTTVRVPGRLSAYVHIEKSGIGVTLR